jgi:molybdopterin converting factor small subunit
MRVKLVHAGRHYDATQSWPPWLELPDGSSLDEAISALAALLPAGQSLPPSCLLSVSTVHLGTVGSHRPVTLRNGDELMLITPVAGG